MARRVLIRSRHENTAVAQIEEMLKADYRAIWKGFRDELEECAEQIESDARYLVPKETHALEESIYVYVTNSRRYPGIIASARALSRYKPGPGGYKAYDYALIQEENEEYLHDEEEESAHYLGGSFVYNISELYYDLTGKELQVNEKLAHAYNYVKDKL